MKTNLEELGIFSGKPEFTNPIHVGRPNIGNIDNFLLSVKDMLDRRWLTNDGQYVRELEKRLSELLNVKHVIAVCNGTVGLSIAAKAIGLTGEVVVPSFTFVATAHAFHWDGITPVFCDVGPGSHHIDPTQIEKHISPRTSGIVGVHVWGAPCEVDALQEITSSHKLTLLFDAAHALGCTYQGKMIGGFGSAEVFSFHATKFFNTFEGGAITTNNDEIARKARLMRNFGFSTYDQVDSIGINGKMSEVHAAMGINCLENFDNLLKTNEQNYFAYQENLQDIPGISLYAYNLNERNNFQYIIVEIEQEIAGLPRDLLVKILHAENVLARRYFFPGVHQMEPYKSLYPNCAKDLPATERLVKRVLSLPTGTAVSAEDISTVCGIIRLAISNSEQIKKKITDES